MALRSIKDEKQTNLKESFQALKNIPRFFKEIRRSGPFQFNLNVFSRLLDSFTPIITLWVGKLIIDEIVLLSQSETADYSNLWMYVAIELGIVIFSDLINRGINLTDGLLGDLYSNASSIRIIRKTNQLNISQLEDSEFYNKLELARRQTASRVNLMTNSLYQIQDLVVMVSLIAGLIFFEPWLIIMLILSIIPSFINELKFSSQRYSVARSWTAERRELDYIRYVGANDKTAKEIKLFGLTDFLAERFKNLSDAYYDVNKNIAVKRTLTGGLLNILGILCYYGAYILIIYRVISGVLTLGDLTFLAGSFRSLRARLQGLFARFTRLSESALYLKDYFDFLDLKVPKQTDTYFSLPEIIKEGFEFKNLKFTYPGSEEEVLSGVSFKLNVGEKLAFVGENGAGKTTLIKLLLRFYEPTSGEILLDGINIQNFRKDEYQNRFGVIFQDFIRYEFLVRENIAVGDISEIDNEEKLDNAAELSLASEVVKQLPDGYDQQLGKRFSKGKDLSGGQWQKIALARAYMKNAEVMILDEPTSALDARAEYEAFQRFIGLTEGKTSIIISHRFSTVRMANRILVLKDGKILEIGTHEELMNNQQLYSELFQLQAAGYQ